MTVCCADADDYTKLPIGQYEEDNILRELNKCLLAFQQKQYKPAELHQNVPQTTQQHCNHRRRLSPIGESLGSNQSDTHIPIITQESCSTNRSASPPAPTEVNKLRVHLENEKNLQKKEQISNEMLVHNRRGRFIVLGSSGECLPVSRKPLLESKSVYSSCESSEEDYQSAKSSFDDGSEDEFYHARYDKDLDTAERRHTFAQRLRDALRHQSKDSSVSSEEESSYVVGISVTGAEVDDRDIK